MAGARAARVKELLEEALQYAAAQRAAFLADACGDDVELCHEVQSLASAYDDAGQFLEVQTSPSGATTFGASGGGSPPDHTDRMAIGTLINGRYRIEGVQGKGGMGVVYRVTDTARSRLLALKTIRGRPALLNLFKTEFRTLVHLRHPNLAQSYDFEPMSGSPDYCFTMDFVDGQNILDTSEGAGWHSIVDLLVQLCRVLAYVHSRGIVHRDIKPNNVLVCPDGTLKLVDFGLVGGGEMEHVIGTPAYLAPELIDGGRGDQRSDLYSFGILAYQLLCRRLPFSAVNVADMLYQHAYSAPTFPNDVDAPSWLMGIVLRLCAKQPADRFRGANQVIEAINRHTGGAYPIETTVTRESYVLSGRFVGRQEHLTELTSFVARRLQSGRGAAPLFAWVTGQSGLGKSRLVRELRHAVQLDRRTFVEGHCFEGAVAEYSAVAEALAQLVPSVVSRGGQALVDTCLSELVKVAPELGRGRDVPPSVALTTPEAERRRLFDTVAEFLVEGSSAVPYVFYIDDLQWAPLGTIEILRHLYRRISLREHQHESVTIAVLGSYRDDEISDHPIESLLEETRTGATVVHLDQLHAHPMQQLLQSMFGLDDIPSNFVTRVLEEADGSPFFLEEVVRALVENGSVFVEDGAWRTASAVGKIEIPASIAATVRRRLAMVVGFEQQHVLRLLAAYKKPMSAAFLATVADAAPEHILAALSELVARHLVTPVGDGDLYRTAHDHIRTTVYAELGSAARDVHRQIGRTLERVSRAEDALLSEIAHHYWLGEEWDKALQYALLAGRAAASVYANDEAIQHLGRALTLLPTDDVEARLRTTEQLADANFLSGYYERARSLLADIEGQLQAPIDRARIRRKLGEILGYHAGTPLAAVEIMWSAADQLGAKQPRSATTYGIATVTSLARHFVQRLAAARLPLARHESERTRLAELITIYLRISYLSFFGDPLLTFLPVFRAANLADRLGESKEHSEAYAMMAVSFAGLGFRKRALRYSKVATAEAERLRSPWHLANANSYHAYVLLQTGDWSGAQEYAELGRTGFAGCGDHFQLAVSLYTALEVLHARGDLATAVAYGREQLAVFERLGLQMIGKGPYTIFGQVLAKTGDAEGLVVGRDVLVRAQQGADKLSTAFAHIALGDSLLHLGRIDEAIEHLEHGLAIRDTGRFDVYVVAHGSALLARAYAEKARSSHSGLAGALGTWFDRRASEAIAAGRRFPALRSPASLVRGLGYRLRGRTPQAIVAFGEAAKLAERQGARLWEAEAHLERGLALIDDESVGRPAGRAALDQARTLFHKCGALPDEQRTLAALARLDSAHLLRLLDGGS
jgi:tetratricopeptide (TPR) repeat protein